MDAAPVSNARDRQREGWTEVFYGSQVRAETLGALLEAAGLTPEVLGDSFGASGGLPAVGAESAGLYVPKHEDEKARHLLAQASGRE